MTPATGLPTLAPPVADHPIRSQSDSPDTPFDVSLRPPMFSEFAGQEKADVDVGALFKK